MSFREEFLEKISGFSSERLRTEQRLLEQERDSLPEKISQLDGRLKSLEEGREKFTSESRPFREEINTIQKNIEDRKKILSHDFLSIPYNKRGKNSFTGFIYFMGFTAFVSTPVLMMSYLPHFDYFFLVGLGVMALIVYIMYSLDSYISDQVDERNKEIESNLKDLISSDKELKKLSESEAPLHKKESEIYAKERDFVKANIDPLKEERSTLDNRIQEISILLTEVLPDLLKTTRKKERNAKYKAVLGEQRNDAQTLKRYLLSETDENWICPYHNEKADRETAEADHIHPVSKGGQSTLQNMVLVCYDCNRGKGDSTLRNFCKVKGFIFEEVCERLESDGKEI